MLKGADRRFQASHLVRHTINVIVVVQNPSIVLRRAGEFRTYERASFIVGVNFEDAGGVGRDCIDKAILGGELAAVPVPAEGGGFMEEGGEEGFTKGCYGVGGRVYFKDGVGPARQADYEFVVDVYGAEPLELQCREGGGGSEERRSRGCR